MLSTRSTRSRNGNLEPGGSPNIEAVNPSDRKASSDSTVIDAPLAKNHMCVDTAKGLWRHRKAS